MTHKPTTARRLALVALAVAASIGAGAAFAQTLKGVRLDHPQIQAGQEVGATIDYSASGNVNCGMRVLWGDGSVNELRIQTEKDMAQQLRHAYAKPGNYEIVVDPQKIKSSLPCVGKKVRATVAVLAPVAPVAAPAPVAVAPAPTAPPPAPAAPAVVMAKPLGPSCPEGWKLDAKSVVKKTGAYSCSAKVGTPLPAQRLNCPGELGYYENVKKGVLGCRA